MSFREKQKLITCGRVCYLELTEFQLILRDRLQKKAVFKLLACSAESTKRFETSNKGKALIGD